MLVLVIGQTSSQQYSPSYFRRNGSGRRRRRQWNFAVVAAVVGTIVMMLMMKESPRAVAHGTHLAEHGRAGLTNFANGFLPQARQTARQSVFRMWRMVKGVFAATASIVWMVLPVTMKARRGGARRRFDTDIVVPPGTAAAVVAGV